MCKAQIKDNILGKTSISLFHLELKSINPRETHTYHAPQWPTPPSEDIFSSFQRNPKPDMLSNIMWMVLPD
jgi:hypothetical protein